MKKLNLRLKPVWFIAPAIVIVWMLALYYFYEIFPFGKATLIAYDLLHGSMPGMYHVYDAWHSGNIADLFYNFEAVGGFAQSLITTIIQPRYLFILFWDRAYLTQAIDLFFVFEFALIAFASSYSFSRIFPKLQAPWLVLVSLIYTFNGFNILYFTNIDWLDVVLIYPLIICFALKTMQGKSKFPFFLSLTYLLVINTYMAFFVVLSLVVFGGLYIFIIEEKEQRKKAVLNLGIGTGASLLASFYSIFDYGSRIFSSARFEEGAYVLDGAMSQRQKLSGLSDILNAENQIDIVAVFMFLGMALAISSLIVLWVHFKKQQYSRKYTIFFTTALLLFVAQIIFKAVMLIWHMGSYQQFPFRNGYMVAFFCCCIIAYYFSHFADFEGIKTKYDLVNVFGFVPAFFAAITVVSYASVFIASLTKNFSVLNDLVEFQTGFMKYPYTGFAIALVVCFLFIKIIAFKKLRNVLTFLLAIIVIGINSFCLIPKGSHLKDGSLYQNEKSLYEKIEQTDVFNRVNNTDCVMISSYPYIAKQPSLSGWVHTASSEKYKSISDMGFSSVLTVVYDSGGTVFSKSLLRITNTLSESELNKDLYTEYDENESGLKFYRNNYTLPVGLVFSEGIKDISSENYDNLFEYQNAIYKELGMTDELFRRVQYKDIKEKTKNEKYFISKEREDGSGKDVFEEKKKITDVKYTFDVDEKSVLYLHNNDNNNPINVIEIQVNGEKLHVFDGVPLIGTQEDFNTAYPNSVNRGILELGVFENQTVNVSIKYACESPTVEGTALYLMELNNMERLQKKFSENNYAVEGREIKLNVKSEDSGIVFIPIGYDKDWKCSVNGKATEPVCVMGSFVGVETMAGDNEIVMNFAPRRACMNLAFIIAGLFLGLALLVAERKINFPKAIYTLAFVAFSVIFVGGMIFIYVLPIIWSVVSNVLLK